MGIVTKHATLLFTPAVQSPVYIKITLSKSSCSRLLNDRPEFTFIPRSRDELPPNFPSDIPGICYFLEAASEESVNPFPVMIKNAQ